MKNIFLFPLPFLLPAPPPKIDPESHPTSTPPPSLPINTAQSSICIFMPLPSATKRTIHYLPW